MEQYLLSYRWKIPGWIMVISGAILSVIYFLYNPRIEFPVFAVFSSYLETRMLAVFRTNITDELIMLLFLAGFSLLAFSRDKNEGHDYHSLRAKALVRAVIASIFLAGFSIIFIYGSGFVGMLILNVFSTLIFYLCFFGYYKFLNYRKGTL